MSRKAAWVAAGVAGLLAATAATAASAAAGGPAATPGWHIVKSVKTDFSGDFTAEVATGQTTAWAFDGSGFSSPPTAWERNGSSWTKVAFPAKTGEDVVVAAASSPSDVWAFTDAFGAGSRALQWNGAKWSVVKTFPEQVEAASVLAPNDIWVFGMLPGQLTPALGVWQFNGHTWTRIAKNFSGGSALSATDVWAFTATSVEHWNGRSWTSSTVKSLLPPVIPGPLNAPSVVGIFALSDSNVYAFGNGNDEDDGGPLVVLHYNGTKWAKVAQGLFGFGPGPQVSTDGDGGLWLGMQGPVEAGGASVVHYADGKLTKATLPAKAGTISVGSVAHIPGTTEELAGGFTYAFANPGTDVVAVLLQYS